MAKGQKEEMKTKLSSFGDKLANKETVITIQKEIIPVETEHSEKSLRKGNKEKDETAFHVYIPTDLLWTVKEIGIKNRIKIKDIFVQALEQYVKNKVTT